MACEQGWALVEEFKDYDLKMDIRTCQFKIC